jgi:hypothetical protein
MTAPLRRPLAALLAGALAAAALPSPHALAQSADDILCQMASEAAASTNAAGPVAVDAVTTQDGVDVICETRTIRARFSRKDDAAAQPEGWRDAWQEKLDGAYCVDPASREIVASGWTLAERTTFADGVVFEIKAACE